MAEFHILYTPGDGIGPEIVAQGRRVLEAVGERFGHTFTAEHAVIGAGAVEKHGIELTDEVIDRARAAGFIPVAHAGEEGPPEYVREALDILKIERLDHGNRSLEDDALVERLAQESMALTVCPLSNLNLKVVADMKNHPLRRMLDLGLKATVNSDDPAYFGGYINENYFAVAEALDLTEAHLYSLARNSFEASFIGEDQKATYIAKLDEFAASNGWQIAG